MVGEGDRAVAGGGLPRVLLRDALAAPNVVTIARLALVPAVVALFCSRGTAGRPSPSSRSRWRATRSTGTSRAGLGA